MGERGILDVVTYQGGGGGGGGGGGTAKLLGCSYA